MRTRSSRNSEDEITLRGIPESVIRTRQLGPNRDSPGHARELSKKNFRSTWRNWKGGLLTRYGHRCGPTCGHLFTIIFFDACTHSRLSLSLSLSLSLPLYCFARPTDCNYFCDTSSPRLFNCAPAIARPMLAIFFPLCFTRTPICRDFVCIASM